MKNTHSPFIVKQEAQLSQRDHTMLCVSKFMLSFTRYGS